MMARTAGLNILGLVLASWIARTSFAQRFGCGNFDSTVLASALYNTTVTSPNYPSDYDINQNCRLLIEVDKSRLLYPYKYIVKVTFNDFELESLCDSAFLKFYDGMDTASSPLGSYCGTTHPEVIYSTGLYLYVEFHTSDSFFPYRGFSFSFSAVEEEEASGICRPSDGSSNVHWLRGSSGTFFTPDYPVPYPDLATCIWIITVPARKRVKLKFENFDFGIVYSSCEDLSNEIDFVQIRDGQDSKSKELGLYCGYVFTPPDVFSTGRYMWVKFYSNAHNSTYTQWGQGFKAHFEAVELSPSSKEMCLPGNLYNNNLTLTGSYGTLQSPQNPDYYPPGSSCDWLITVPEGKTVKLRFDRFELKPAYLSSCLDDYVEVLDGKSRYSGTKGKFCGYTKPEDIRSSGRYMWVLFRADHSTNAVYEGFKATFTAEDQPSTSWALIIGVAVGVVVFVGLVCCFVCVAKRKKTPSRAAGVGMPMTATTSASASQATQPGITRHPPPNPIQQPAVNPYAPPPVGYAPVPTNPSSPPPPYPYPSESPPPYPGKETVPQYPPPGQPYPWLQSAPAPSAPAQSP